MSVAEVLAASSLPVEHPIEAGTLWRCWNELVGDTIAMHAGPSSLRAGVLRIRAESPAWAMEIGYLREEIRRRVNESLGREIVTEVRVWTGPPGGVDGCRHPKATTPSSAERPAAPATDPGEAFERARAAWRRRASGGSPKKR
jgi:hypothetical protein